MYVEKAYSTVDSDSSVGWGRLAWRPPWSFSRRAGYEPAPGFTFSLPVIIIPHNTITLHKQLHIQSSYPQLPPIHYTDTRPTRNVVCPSGAWIENRPHSTPSIRLARNPKQVIVLWVGIRTHTLAKCGYVYLGLRARQHLRSLAPVMKWWWMIMMAKWYSGTLWA